MDTGRERRGRIPRSPGQLNSWVATTTPRELTMKERACVHVDHRGNVLGGVPVSLKSVVTEIEQCQLCGRSQNETTPANHTHLPS